MSTVSFDEMLRLLPVTSLENNPKSVEFFLNRADLIYSKLNKESSKSFFLNYIKSLTTGTINLRIKPLSTWKLIKSELKNFIWPYKPILQRLQDQLSISQFPEETILSYSDRLFLELELLNESYKLKYTDFSTEIFDFLCLVNMHNSLDIFVKGIYCKDLKTILQGRDYKTLTEAVKYARDKEMLLIDSNNRKNSVQSENYNSNVFTAPIKKVVPRKKNIFKCGLCFRLGHQSKFCRHKQNASQFTDLPLVENIIPSNSYTCEFCSRTGHITQFCRFTKAKQTNPLGYQTFTNVPQVTQVFPLSTQKRQNGTQNVQQMPHVYPKREYVAPRYFTQQMTQVFPQSNQEMSSANLNTMSSNVVNQTLYQLPIQYEFPQIKRDLSNLNTFPGTRQNFTQVPEHFKENRHRLNQVQNNRFNLKTDSILSQSKSAKKDPILNPSSISKTDIGSQENLKLPVINLFDPKVFPILSQFDINKSNCTDLCESNQKRQENPRPIGT